MLKARKGDARRGWLVCTLSIRPKQCHGEGSAKLYIIYLQLARPAYDCL